VAVEGSTTRDVFEAYVEWVLLPRLGRSRIFVMDNLAAHKSERIRN
jgi:hypothetical protein